MDRQYPAERSDERRKFQIFRTAGAPELNEAHPMTYENLTPTVEAGLGRVMEAGILEGSDVRQIFDMPGFSLTYAWFKSGFPLPRHSHQDDCLYYIVSGALKLGNQILGKGDGFFIPGGMPYSYTPCDDGVEVLEFRHNFCGDITVLAENAAFWDRAVGAVANRRDRWRTETTPAVA